MKITKEELANRFINWITVDSTYVSACPSAVGLKNVKCLTGSINCEYCWKQAIEQGVEK